LIDQYERPVPQFDGHRLAGLNCTCASGACVTHLDSRGNVTVTSGQVRDRVREPNGLPDVSGGTNLPQVDTALRSLTHADRLDVRNGIPFDDAVNEVQDGRPCILQGGYGPIADYGLSGSPGFRGNHAITWSQVRVVRNDRDRIDYARSRGRIYCSLWDGRRAGIPSKIFRWVPLSVLRDFAGALVLNSGNRLGAGRAYVGFARDLIPDVVKPPPAAPIDYGANTMIVAGGLTLSSSHVMALKASEPLYRSPSSGASVVTRMAKAGKVAYLGNAAAGWRAVLVQTGNFPDGQKRPVIVYVPSSKGEVSNAA
jgi:hypothetical protein